MWLIRTVSMSSLAKEADLLPNKRCTRRPQAQKIMRGRG
jgi:hypothetical protein